MLTSLLLQKMVHVFTTWIIRLGMLGSYRKFLFFSCLL